MTSDERRAAILQLMAEIDQSIAESVEQARSELLTPDERRRARAYGDFYRMSAERTERLLAGTE